MLRLAILVKSITVALAATYPSSPESDPPVSLFRPLNRSGLRLSVSKIN
jgi:hypothetical protein